MMLGYLYCIRQKDLNQTIIDLVKKYFFMGTLKIDSDKIEYIYTDGNHNFYSNKYVAKETFFNIYNRFKRDSSIILPIKCYEVYYQHCILVEEINKNYTNTNLNFKVWGGY